MSDPFVSVVLPTFNRSALLRRSIEGVLRQTFGDFELIVVDDHSSDDTPKVLLDITDPRVRVLRHERRLGASAARNWAVREARGTYVCFHDDDDEWLPQKLALQVEAYSREQDPDRVLLYTQVIVDDGISSNVRPRAGLGSDEPLCEYIMRGHGLIATPSIMATRKLIAANPFPPQSSQRFPKSRDLSLLLGLEAQGVRFVLVEQPLVVMHTDIGRVRLSHSDLSLEEAVKWLGEHGARINKTSRTAYLAREVAPFLGPRSGLQVVRLVGVAVVTRSIPLSEGVKSLFKAFLPPRVLSGLRHVFRRSRFG
jgi:glycosyltransferase involved in cell wall biosynthesis